jgi:hypothetical protein
VGVRRQPPECRDLEQETKKADTSEPAYAQRVAHRFTCVFEPNVKRRTSNVDRRTSRLNNFPYPEM